MKYHYPAAGGLPVPTNCQLVILTTGGQHIMGRWRDDGDFLAWRHPPERDHDAEDQLRATEVERALGVFPGS